MAAFLVFSQAALLAAARELPQPAVSDALFARTNVLSIEIRISDGEMRRLRGQGSREGSKPAAAASVFCEGVILSNVTVQLKGYTTFRSIDDLPSLTLKFRGGDEFFGLRKISLNNSLQDRTRLHEKLSRELFEAAGVPVARATFAHVTLNDRTLGLYVLTEGYDRRFLERWFERTDGNFYEGRTLQDITAPLEKIPGGLATNAPDVQQLIAAAREPDPSLRMSALEQILDLDRFLSMMAMETILCHSDSYSMNRNNYRLYRDPKSGRFTFMPHGMDRVLGTHRSPIDLTLVPPSLGLVAHAIMTSAEGRKRYIARVAELANSIFRTMDICRRIAEIDAQILETKLKFPAGHEQFDASPSLRHEEDAGTVCRSVRRRSAEIQTQLAHIEELVAPVPLAVFDADGTAPLGNWQVRHRTTDVPFAATEELQENQTVLRLDGTEGPITGALQHRVALLPGSYRLVGRVQSTDALGATNRARLSLVRYSTSRFAIERANLSPAGDFSFRVSSQRDPDEIAFVCELRDAVPPVILDFSSLRLIRQQARPPSVEK